MGTIAAPTVVGGSIGPMRAYSAEGMFAQPGTITMSASYATGGDTVTLPADISKLRKLWAIEVLTPMDGTRFYAWDGSTTTPKIKAFTAANAEASAATNLSSVTLRVMFIWV